MTRTQELSRLNPAAANIAVNPVEPESIQTRAAQVFYSSSVVIRVLNSLACPKYRLLGRSGSTGQCSSLRAKCWSRLSRLLPKSGSNRVGHLFLVRFDRVRRGNGRQCRPWVLERLLDEEGPLRSLMALGQETSSETFQRGVGVDAMRYSSAEQKCAKWYENISCFQFVKGNPTGGELLLDQLQLWACDQEFAARDSSGWDQLGQASARRECCRTDAGSCDPRIVEMASELDDLLGLKFSVCLRLEFCPVVFCGRNAEKATIPEDCMCSHREN